MRRDFQLPVRTGARSLAVSSLETPVPGHRGAVSGKVRYSRKDGELPSGSIKLISPRHIAQLRQTLDAGAAKELANLSYLPSPDRHVVVPIGYRRAELQHLKPAPVPTDAGLALKDRAGTLAFDR